MTRTAILAYGALGLPLAFAALPLYVHVPHLYAEASGMALTQIGLILLLARLFDALIDPWFGWLADRLPRRTLLAGSLVPFVFGFIALLNPPAGPNALVWLAASLTLTYLGFSGASVAYQAWGASVGGHPLTRTRLTAAREGFGLLGIVLAAALPGMLSDDLSTGTTRLAWVLPPLLLLAAGITFSQVAGDSAAARPAAPLGNSLRRALGAPAFRRLLIVFVFNGIAAALPATLFLFFVADVLDAATAAGPLLTLYFVAGAASLPLWVALARRHGRVTSWGLAMALAMISFAGASLLGPGDIAGFAAICLAAGLALGADLALPAAIAADLAERQGQSGACFGIWNFVAKLNLALAAGLALPLLEQLGYRPGGSEGLAALTFAYALLPLGFKLVAVLLLLRWRSFLETHS